MLSLVLATLLTLVELNCENLFDYRHDEGKQDLEWTPDGARHWTPARYWRKLNNIGQEILSCAEPFADRRLPDLVALVEVENDSVLFDLTRRSLLRNAGYDYLMTSSPDVRGIDVALLYQPLSFRPLSFGHIRIEPLEGMRPTRDILYVKGETAAADTLHLFVVHAPSRYGGERPTRPHRRLVAERLTATLDSICTLQPQANIIIAGDFNDEATAPALQYLQSHHLANVTATARGYHAQTAATYRYQGRWQSIDHVLVSSSMAHAVRHAYINDAPFLLEEDHAFGGFKPFRTYAGYRYQPGFSDHLPLIVRYILP